MTSKKKQRPLRLPDDLDQRVEEYAKQHGLKFNEAMIELTKKSLNGWKEPPQESHDDMIEGGI